MRLNMAEDQTEKECAPMRIPESLRAIGIDGFRISSLQNKHKKQNKYNCTTIRKTCVQVSNRYQILMMLSLSSFLRLIFACIVAAILHQGPSENSFLILEINFQVKGN